MSREGDWMCAACHHLNFQKRDECQRCCCPKYAVGADEVSAYSVPRNEILAGDWYCSCGTHNYASRMVCYRCCASKAAVMASNGYPNVPIPGWKQGDWICSRVGCNMHNYACRTECYKCKMPRDYRSEEQYN